MWWHHSVVQCGTVWRNEGGGKREQGKEGVREGEREGRREGGRERERGRGVGGE